MSRMSDTNENSNSLIGLCFNLKKLDSTPPCLINVCSLLSMAVQIGQKRDQCDIDRTEFMEHSLHVMSIAGKLLKMVATCPAVPNSIAVNFVTGHTARAISTRSIYRNKINEERQFKKQVTVLFGSSISELVNPNNPKRDTVCEMIEKMASECERAEALLNQRFLK